MGLPSESEDSSVPEQQGDNDEDEDEDNDEVTDAPGSIPSPAPSVPSMPEVPSLGQSQLTASLASVFEYSQYRNGSRRGPPRQV
jgi:hypothetical protein